MLLLPAVRRRRGHSCSIFRSSQGFFQRSCRPFFFSKRLPQRLSHCDSTLNLSFTTSVVVSVPICLGASHRPQSLCLVVAAQLFFRLCNSTKYLSNSSPFDDFDDGLAILVHLRRSPSIVPIDDIAEGGVEYLQRHFHQPLHAPLLQGSPR